MNFPTSCIHIGNSLDIYSFYFVLILIHMDSELARKSSCRTTYRAPLGQTLDWTAKTPSLPVNSNNEARSGSITYLKVPAVEIEQQ